MSEQATSRETVVGVLQSRAAAYPMRGSGRFKLWLRTVGVCVGIVMVLYPLASNSIRSALDPRSVLFWLRMLAAILVSMVGVAEADRAIHRIRQNPHAAAARLESRLKVLTGRGWVFRTIGLGILLALAVGTPVALLNASTTAAFKQNQVYSAARFVARTIIWAVPLAFVIRFAYVGSWARQVDHWFRTQAKRP